MRKYKLLVIIMLIVSASTYAQILDPNDMLLDYYKVLEMKNPEVQERMNIHPSILNGSRKDSLKWNPWEKYLVTLNNEEKSFKWVPWRTKVSFNSKYARGYNDGAVWQGRGMTIQTQTGFMGKYGHLRYAFVPIVYWSQNQAYELAENMNSNINPYNYQFRSRGYIDYVQRFGDNDFYDFDLGQSEIRAVFNWFTLGFSTQNIVFGPAQRNPLLLGNSGGMIPHMDLGTDRPVNTPIGKIEGKIYWGKMSESDYNNSISTNSNQYFTALSFGYSPKWIKGLYLGANRVFYKQWEDISFSDYLITIIRFNPPKDRVFGNDEYDQTGSFMMKWSYPEVGFQAYMEFAKSDFGGNIFRSEPEHGRALTAGLIKLIEFEDVNVKLTYEHTTIGQPKNSIIRSYNRYYSHSVNRNGYTHQGQLLGAGIGPGSNSSWFDAKMYFNSSMFGATMQRIRFDDDYFFENFTEKENHDYEWSWGIQYEKIMSVGRLGLEFSYARRRGTYFIEENTKRNIYTAISFVKPI